MTAVIFEEETDVEESTKGANSDSKNATDKLVGMDDDIQGIEVTGVQNMATEASPACSSLFASTLPMELNHFRVSPNWITDCRPMLGGD